MTNKKKVVVPKYVVGFEQRVEELKRDFSALTAAYQLEKQASVQLSRRLTAVGKAALGDNAPPSAERSNAVVLVDGEFYLSDYHVDETKANGEAATFMMIQLSGGDNKFFSGRMTLTLPATTPLLNKIQLPYQRRALWRVRIERVTLTLPATTPLLNKIQLPYQRRAFWRVRIEEVPK